MFPTTNNLATATSDQEDIAIAFGDGATAGATGGVGDFAIASGAGAGAFAEDGNFNTATADGVNAVDVASFGNNDRVSIFDPTATASEHGDYATAEFGNNNLASIIGGAGDSYAQAANPVGVSGDSDNNIATVFDPSGTQGSVADAGGAVVIPGSFDFAAVFGDALHAFTATEANYLTDILSNLF